ncbi:MAG TPA: glycoside hydrolase family 172 protein [Candidatus Methylacidiphilales bacterium]|jgi:hypothetical protein|nr:glycoside hydrolase family 172 protein [Candidatus Methylacidiphilales bacterium]
MISTGLDTLYRLSDAKTRSISAENPQGEKGRGATAIPDDKNCARDLGQGWKVRPSIPVKPGETVVFADIQGPGVVQHFWLSGDIAARGAVARNYIFRVYWDDEPAPAIECPVADFFASAWGPFAQISSLPVAVNPNRGFNAFWPMPFRRRCRMTLENRHEEEMTFYYQVDYALTAVPDDAAYFHAQFRRVNPLPYKTPYTILDGVRGRGHYVGTILHWGVNNNGWFGEGEIKFYLDGDGEFPTICGTGTEDYFGGAYNWDVNDQYVPYTTPFLGMHQVIRPDGRYKSQHRHAMYRWHILDPIRFEKDLRVTIQALGWRSGRRFMPLQDDIASVACWYQTLPAAPFPPLPDREYLEVV